MDQTALAKQVHTIMRERMRAYGLIPAIRENFWEVKGLDLHKEARKCGVMDVYDLLDQEPDLFRREGDGWRALPNKDSTDKKAIVKLEKKEDSDNGNQSLDVPKIGQNIKLPNDLYEALQHWLERKGLLLSDMEEAIQGWKSFKPENDREMSMVHQGLSADANTIYDLEYELFVAKKSLEMSFERLRLSVKDTTTDANTVEEKVRLRVGKLHELKKRELAAMKKWTMLDLKNEILVSMLAEVFLNGSEQHMTAFENDFIVGNEMCFLTAEETPSGFQVSQDDTTNKSGVPSNSKNTSNEVASLFKFIPIFPPPHPSASTDTIDDQFQPGVSLKKKKKNSWNNVLSVVRAIKLSTPKSVGFDKSWKSSYNEPNEEGQGTSSSIVEPGAFEMYKSIRGSVRSDNRQSSSNNEPNGEEQASSSAHVGTGENGPGNVHMNDVPKGRREVYHPYGDLTQAHNNRTGQMKASHSQGSSTSAHHPTGSEYRMKFSNVPVVGQKVDQIPAVLYNAIQSRLDTKKVIISDLDVIMKGWEDVDPSEAEFPLIHQVLSKDESTLSAIEYDMFFLKSTIKRSFERLNLPIDDREVEIPDIQAMVVSRIEDLRDMIQLENDTLEKWSMIDYEDKEVVKLLTDLFMNKTEEDILEFEKNYLAGCVKEVRGDGDSSVNRPHLSVVPSSSRKFQLPKELKNKIYVWIAAKELTISKLTDSIKGWERFEPKYNSDIAIVDEVFSADKNTLSDFEQHIFTDEKTFAEVFKQMNSQFEYKEVDKTDVAEKMISRVKELIERRSYIQETLEKWKMLEQVVMKDVVVDLLTETFFKGTTEDVINFETNYLDDFLMEMFNEREVRENVPRNRTEAKKFENAQANAIDENDALSVAPAVIAIPNAEQKKPEKQRSIKKDDTDEKKKDNSVKETNEGKKEEKEGKGRGSGSASRAKFKTSPFISLEGIVLEMSGKQDRDWNELRDNSANKYENSVEEFEKNYDVFEKTFRESSLKAGQRTALDFLNRRIEGFESTEANVADFHIGLNQHHKALRNFWGVRIGVDEVDKLKKLIREDMHQRLNVYRSLRDMIEKLPPKTIIKICYLDSLYNLDNFLIMEHGFIKQDIMAKIERKLEEENI